MMFHGKVDFACAILAVLCAALWLPVAMLVRAPWHWSCLVGVGLFSLAGVLAHLGYVYMGRRRGGPNNNSGRSPGKGT